MGRKRNRHQTTITAFGEPHAPGQSGRTQPSAPVATRPATTIKEENAFASFARSLLPSAVRGTTGAGSPRTARKKMAKLADEMAKRDPVMSFKLKLKPSYRKLRLPVVLTLLVVVLGAAGYGIYTALEGPSDKIADTLDVEKWLSRSSGERPVEAKKQEPEARREIARRDQREDAQTLPRFSRSTTSFAQEPKAHPMATEALAHPTTKPKIVVHGKKPSHGKKLAHGKAKKGHAKLASRKKGGKKHASLASHKKKGKKAHAKLAKGKKKKSAKLAQLKKGKKSAAKPTAAKKAKKKKPAPGQAA
jgi:hypothetical protein